MNEEQANTMIELLAEISNKLSEISNKIGSDIEYKTISEKLDKLDRLDRLDEIYSKVRNIDSQM